MAQPVPWTRPRPWPCQGRSRPPSHPRNKLQAPHPQSPVPWPTFPTSRSTVRAHARTPKLPRKERASCHSPRAGGSWRERPALPLSSPASLVHLSQPHFRICKMGCRGPPPGKAPPEANPDNCRPSVSAQVSSRAQQDGQPHSQEDRQGRG